MCEMGILGASRAVARGPQAGGEAGGGEGIERKSGGRDSRKEQESGSSANCVLTEGKMDFCEGKNAEE
ncbi:MAG: hypothetical protein WC331_11480, partial [Candidatus Omnitrophota bacterium]